MTKALTFPKLQSKMLDYNSYDSDGWTALHAAVLLNDSELVRFLLAEGADPNIRDIAKYGRTPFILAICMQDKNVIEAFTDDWRSDWMKVDDAGLNATHYAAYFAILSQFK